MEISNIALDLFEVNGVDATTVAEIADAANVSQRTFFRYFETKESSLFREEPEYAASIEEWGQTPGLLQHPLNDLLDALEAASHVMLADSGERQVRIMHLERSFPSLSQGRVAAEAKHNERLDNALRRRLPDTTPDEQVVLIRRIARALVDSSVEEWLIALDSHRQANFSDIFAKNRAFAATAIGD